MNKLQRNNLKFYIILAVLTLLSCFLISIFAFGIFLNCAPQNASKLSFEMGDNNSGIYFLSRIYSKDKSTKNLYNVVKNSIVYENSHYMLEYAPKLFDKQDLFFILENNAQENSSITNILSKKVNYHKEYNMLTNYYVKNLMNNDKIHEAVDFCAKILSNLSTSEISIDSMLANPAYYFVSHQRDERLITRQIEAYAKSLSQIAKDYYDKLKTVYDAIDFDNVSPEDQLKVAVFASHIIDAGNTMAIISLLNGDTAAKNNYETAVEQFTTAFDSL